VNLRLSIVFTDVLKKKHIMFMSEMSVVYVGQVCCRGVNTISVWNFEWDREASQREPGLRRRIHRRSKKEKRGLTREMDTELGKGPIHSPCELGEPRVCAIHKSGSYPKL